MKKSLFLKAFLAFIVAVLFLNFLNVFINQDAFASDRALNYGYFYNQYFNSTGNKVIRGGIPSWVDTKSEFINYIKNLYNTPANTYDGRNNKIGAAYIIQTMRGPDAAGKWDHSLPDASDITDWTTKINNSEITVKWNEFYSGKINTRTNPIDNNTRDVVEYDTGSNTTYESIVFYKGTTRMYVVKRACGNPLGSLAGLPPPPSGTFHLTPTVTVNGATSGSTVVEAGSSYPVIGSVNNSGTIDSPTATYRLVKTITNPSSSSTASGSQVFRANTTVNVKNYSESVPDYDPGTRICFVLYVKPHSTSEPTVEVASSSVCVIIAKKPKVQIWGGDLWVGRQFSGVVGGIAGTQTSTTVKNGNMFGSWVEYGIFASGSINGTASGSAFAKTGLSGVASACDYSTLSFANTPSTATTCTGAVGTIGNFTNATAIPDISASFPTGGSTPVISGSVNVTTLNGLYKSNTNLSLVAGTIPTGHWIVISAPGRTVTIAGNINYTNALLHNIGEIPQLVIIADRININGNVTNVDAWLIAKNSSGTGSIYTCDIIADTINKCNQSLRVNGPVMTQKLNLRRTGGSGSGNASGDAAETFNLRADAYLWAIGRASSNGRIRTVYSTELPPRF